MSEQAKPFAARPNAEVLVDRPGLRMIRFALGPGEALSPHFAPRARAMISLFMQGGPAQMDSFDPKSELTKLDGQPLPPRYGFPMKLRMPTKLGYKNPKHIQAIFVTNTYPGGYWEDQGYNWFGGS